MLCAQSAVLMVNDWNWKRKMNNFNSRNNRWRSILPVLAGALMLAACDGAINGPPATPVIVVQPADVSVVEGSAAGFSVTATGTARSYQWQGSVDGGAHWSDISGASASTYTLATTVLGDSGRLFRVLVTAAGVTVTSSAAQLTVTMVPQAPAITVQPVSQTVTEPDSAMFSVTATGTSLQYQWQLSSDGSNWSDIGGATAASYATSATSAAASGVQIRVQVSNTVGSVTSDPVVLTINPMSSANSIPSFVTQPANQSVAEGSGVTFSATVTGTPTPALQWQRSNNDGGSWNDIAGASNNSYSIAVVTAGDGGALFRLSASNSEGTTNSDAARLTVTATNAAPDFITQPQDATVNEGNSAHFSVAANGVPTPSFQWQVSCDGGASWSNINGATSSSYDTPATVAADDAKRFRAVASNSQGTVNSNAATLTVTPSASGWQGVQQQGMGDMYSIRLVRNANGQAAMIWTGDTGTGHGLFLRRYDPVNGWSAAESVVASVYGDMGVGMDNQGNITVAWIWGDPDAYNNPQRTWAIRYSAGSGWGATLRQPLPDPVQNGPGNGQAVVLGGVAVNPAGGVTVLWSQYDSPCNCGKFNLIAATFGAAGWGDLHILYPQTVEGGATYTPSGMQVAVGSDGHAVLLWARRSDAGPGDVWATHFTAGDTSGSSVAIASMLTGADMADNISAIGLDAAGNAIAAWEQYDDSSHRQRVRVSRYNGVWETPRWMSTDSSEITRGPRVTFAANGDALVSASSFLSSASSVDWRAVATPCSASGAWGAMQLVQDTGSNIQPLVFGAIDADGVFTVVYQDGSGFVRASRRAPGDVWTAPEIISALPNNNGGGSNSLRVLGLPDDDILTAWTAPNTQPPYLVRTNVFKAAP